MRREGSVRASGFICLAFLLMASMAASAATAAARQPPAAIVIDANTGRMLHEDAADAVRYPASLTKLMTLFIVFEEMAAGRLRESDQIVFSARASARPPSKLGLKPGDSLTVGEAIRALITKSANDASTAVAEHIAGSEAAFARRMTATAQRLGMKATQYRNASGLPDPSQLTTARDTAILVLALQDRYPRQSRLFALRKFTFRGRTYRNHNRLLGRVVGVDGMKTGYTRASGFNIAASLRHGGKHIVGVVIGQKTGRVRDRLMRNLLLAALPKAVRGKRSREPALVAAVPRLVAHPRLVERSVPPPALSGMPVQTADHRIPAREPSTLADQHARLTHALASPPDASPAKAGDSVDGQGIHEIQVGAFFDKSDALRALDGARSRAGALLAGSRAVTLRVPGKPRTIYRARFAGFGRDEANRTCAELKRVAVDCFVTTSR